MTAWRSIRQPCGSLIPAGLFMDFNCLDSGPIPILEEQFLLSHFLS